MKCSAVRKKYLISSHIKNFLKHYGICLLIFSSLAILSILTGAFSVSKYDGGLTEKDFFDKILYQLSEGNATFWRILFNRIFYILLIAILSFITSQNKFLLIINVFITMIVCYLIGMDIGIIFSLFSLKGIIFCTCVYIPIILLTIFSLLILNCVFIKKVREFTKYGMVCDKKDVYVVLTIIMLLLTLLQSCIFPVFNNIFVIIT